MKKCRSKGVSSCAIIFKAFVLMLYQVNQVLNKKKVHQLVLSILNIEIVHQMVGFVMLNFKKCLLCIGFSLV